MEKTAKKTENANINELIDFIVDRTEFITVPGFNKKIKINKLTLPQMISLEKESGNQDDALLKIALGITDKQVKQLKENGDGIKYANLVKAIGRAYSVSDNDVKK